MNKFITEWKKRFPHEDLPANLIDYLVSGDFSEYKRKFKDVYPDKVEFVEWYEKNKGLSAVEIIEKHIKVRKKRMLNIKKHGVNTMSSSINLQVNEEITSVLKIIKTQILKEIKE